jgi:sodium/bile acid cotransporter 7
MKLKKLFLPVGLILAIAGALWLPGAGIWLKQNYFVPFFVVAIFLISGWKFSLCNAKLNHKFIYAVVTAIVISLFIAPFIGVGTVKIFGFEAMAALGIIVTCCVPVTLSSATVITEVAHGNAVWALLMTVIMNLTGIFTIPLMLKLCLEEAEGVNISAWKLLLKLILLVLLPFAAGMVARKLTKVKTKSFVAYIPSICVILTVYTAAAASRELLYKCSFSEILSLTAAVFSIHALLMLIAWPSGKLLKLESHELKALIFISSQKTLPLSISVLALLCENPGAAIISCLLFHFTQLFVDSAIAARFASGKTITN